MSDHTIVTASGRLIDYVLPDYRQICIEDIATGLAGMPRFSAQTLWHYSVAQHSVLCAKHCKTHPLEALLHDATEAFACDIPRPLKDLLPEYRKVEARLHKAICRALGISHVIPPEVKAVDIRMLETERRVLQRPSPHWSLIAEPLEGVVIARWTPAVARTKFLRAYSALKKERELCHA